MAGEIVLSPHPDVTVPDVALHEFVLEGAMGRADQAALIDGPSGRTLTYGQLAGGVRRVAAGLAARGFAKGDVFAIYCPNLPEYALAFYGVSAAGGVNTTINPLYTADELARQLTDARARFLLTVPPFLDKALEAAGRSGVEEVFVLGEAEGASPFASLLSAGDTPPAVDIDPASDLVALPYSSGTTGISKGVMLTHRNLVANLCQGAPTLLADEGERLIAVLPFFHIYGLVVLMASALSRGATLVTMPRFDLEQFLGPAPGPAHHPGVRGPADRARPGQAPAGRQVRPVGAQVGLLRRRPPGRQPGAGLHRPAGLRGHAGLGPDRDQPGGHHQLQHAPGGPSRGRSGCRCPTPRCGWSTRPPGPTSPGARPASCWSAVRR